MLWRDSSIEPQRQHVPCGEAAISVVAKGNDGAAPSRRFHRFDRDMGGCRS